MDFSVGYLVNEDEVSLMSKLIGHRLSSEKLLVAYYTVAYAKTRIYKAAADLLEVNWRAVRERIDLRWLR